MKTLICISAAFLFAFNTTTAQKTASSLWNWDSAVKKQAEYFYKNNSQGRYFDMPGQGTAPADVFTGAKEMGSTELESCSKHCPVSDGSLPCALIAEDYCPMTGNWHSRINQSPAAELKIKNTVVTDLSFSIVK